MKTKSVKIYDEITKDKIFGKLLKILPKNSSVLDKNNKCVDQYLQYCSIENDLEFLRITLKKLLEIRYIDYTFIEESEFYDDPNLLVKRSLFISLVTTYCRCFNYSKGRKKLDINFIKKQKVEGYQELMDLHQEIINIRNKFIAHSDDIHLENILAYIEFEYGKKEIFSKITYAYSGAYSFNEDELFLLQRLINLLLENVHKKMKKACDKIVEDITKEGLIRLGINLLNDTDREKFVSAYY